MNMLLIFHNEINPAFGFTVVVCPKLISYKVASLYEASKKKEALEILRENAITIRYVPSNHILHKQIMGIIQRRSFLESCSFSQG